MGLFFVVLLIIAVAFVLLLFLKSKKRNSSRADAQRHSVAVACSWNFVNVMAPGSVPKDGSLDRFIAKLKEDYVNLRHESYGGSGLRTKVLDWSVALEIARVRDDGSEANVDLAHIVEDQKKRTVLTGQPGSGKTGILMRIAALWANGELWTDMFDVVVLFQLRHVDVAKCNSLRELIVAGCFAHDDDGHGKDVQAFLKWCPDNAYRVLWLIDGCDEVQIPTFSVIASIQEGRNDKQSIFFLFFFFMSAARA